MKKLDFMQTQANLFAEIVARTGSSTRCMHGRGITAVIKAKFFPDYAFRPSACNIAPPKHVHNSKNGMSRGRLVDGQIQKWIKSRNDIIKKKPPTMHLFARAFVELTKKLKLTPIGTQIVVRDERCDIATLVDSVFINSKGRVVIVELKTGFEGYNDTSNARMKGKFSYLSNAPANQHQLQLAFTRCMFEGTFPEFGEVHALLIRMTDSGAHVRSLDRRVGETAKEIVRRGMV